MPTNAAAYQRDLYAKFKNAIYEALGSVCKRCGFSDRRALQIDHVTGGGWRGNRVGQNGLRRNKGYGYKYLRDIFNDPNLRTKFQILCANCNWIKRHENKEAAGTAGLEH